MQAVPTSTLQATTSSSAPAPAAGVSSLLAESGKKTYPASIMSLFLGAVPQAASSTANSTPRRWSIGQHNLPELDRVREEIQREHAVPRLALDNADKAESQQRAKFTEEDFKSLLRPDSTVWQFQTVHVTTGSASKMCQHLKMNTDQVALLKTRNDSSVCPLEGLTPCIVKELRFIDCSFELEAFQIICRGIAANNSLSLLHFQGKEGKTSGIEMTQSMFSSLKEALQTSTIETLRIINMSLDLLGFKELVAGINRQALNLTPVRRLCLQVCGLDRSFDYPLGELIANNGTLIELDLSFNNLGTKKVSTKNRKPHAEQLEAPRHISAAAAAAGATTAVGSASEALSAPAIKIFATPNSSMLRKKATSAVAKQHVSGSKRSKAINAIAWGLRKNRKLVVLSLCTNNIQVTDYQALKEAMEGEEGNLTITINLHGNELSPPNKPSGTEKQEGAVQASTSLMPPERLKVYGSSPRSAALPVANPLPVPSRLLVTPRRTTPRIP